jgi:hypothetical protein
LILLIFWNVENGVWWRLARTESAPLADLVNYQELPLLMEFLEETTGLVDEAAWADRPFAAPNPSGSRFSDGSFGVFHAGADLDTCIAEMAHYQVKNLRQSSAPGMRVHFSALRCHVSGHFVDVRSGHDALHAPDNHAEGRTFGMAAKRAGADGIAYRSVRKVGGECLAIFLRRCVMSCATSVQAAWSPSSGMART